MKALSNIDKKNSLGIMILGVLEREYANSETPEMFGYLYETGIPVLQGNEGIMARRLLRKLHKQKKIPHLKITREEYRKAIKPEEEYKTNPNFMFSLNENNNIYLYNKDVDMRLEFDSLAGLISSSSELDPRDGSVYMFCNKNRTSLKLIRWEYGGYIIYYKRLEKIIMPASIFESETVFRKITREEITNLIITT